VTHNASIEEFVVNRVLTQRSIHWLEVGWGEHSDRADDQEVYTFDTEEGTWQWHTQYNLVTGYYEAFRTRNCTDGGGDDKQCAEIYWSGTWQLLRYSNPADCRDLSGMLFAPWRSSQRSLRTKLRTRTPT